MAARGIGHDLGLEARGIVQAGGADGEELRHGGEGHIDRRAAGRAEMARLLVAAIGNHLPGGGLAAELHAAAQEGEMREMAGAAFALAVAALAVIGKDRLAADLIADRPAGAAARIGGAGSGLAHGLAPFCWMCWVHAPP